VNSRPSFCSLQVIHILCDYSWGSLERGASNKKGAWSSSFWVSTSDTRSQNLILFDHWRHCMNYSCMYRPISNYKSDRIWALVMNSYRAQLTRWSPICCWDSGFQWWSVNNQSINQSINLFTRWSYIIYRKLITILNNSPAVARKPREAVKKFDM